MNRIRHWYKKNSQRGLVDWLLIICPNSPIYRCFNCFVTICRLISCYIYGYLAAFRMSQHSSPLMESLVWPLEGIFFIHCILQFFVEYKDEDGMPVRNLTKISLRYIGGDFSTDFISLIPFQLIDMGERKR